MNSKLSTFLKRPRGNTINKAITANKTRKYMNTWAGADFKTPTKCQTCMAERKDK